MSCDGLRNFNLARCVSALFKMRRLVYLRCGTEIIFSGGIEVALKLKSMLVSFRDVKFKVKFRQRFNGFRKK